MLFTLGECTEDLFKVLNLPESLRESRLYDPISQYIVYNSEERIALIMYPSHHGYYPDQYRNLCINGQILSVLERPQGADIPDGVVEVTLPNPDFELEDVFLITVISQAFCVYFQVKECPYNIKIEGRRLQPRSPQNLVTYLNKLVVALDGANEFAIQRFVPFCVRNDEFDAFIAYLEQSLWFGLSVQAKELVERALAYKAKVES